MEQADYDRLVYAVIQALVDHASVVYVAFNSLTKFPKGFPKGYILDRWDFTHVRRIPTKKLLKWLQANGHTTATSESVRASLIEHSKLLGMLKDKEYNDNYDGIISSLEGDDELELLA